MNNKEVFNPPKKMRCIDNEGYEFKLTEGKVYEVIRKELRILPTGNDYYVVVGDHGYECVSHTRRWEEVK